MLFYFYDKIYVPKITVLCIHIIFYPVKYSKIKSLNDMKFDFKFRFLEDNRI